MVTKNVLIIGATSAIAQEVARLYGAKDYNLFLVGRNANKLKALVDDLAVRSKAKVGWKTADLLDFSCHHSLIQHGIEFLGGLDMCLLAHGSLSDQAACESNYEIAEKEYQVNFLSFVSLLSIVSNYFYQKRGGVIAALSSVAGDRGRQSNYFYGSAKGALNIFLQGMRNRLHNAGVNVLTVKLGFVDTPMTTYIKKNVLFVQPQTVAKSICEAMENRRNEVYIPSFWKIIMKIIKAIPEPIFINLKL